MEKNLFEQAKDMIDDFFSEDSDHEEHAYQEEDKEAVRRTINAAYDEATPEQKEALRQLEQQLDDRLDLD